CSAAAFTSGWGTVRAGAGGEGTSGFAFGGVRAAGARRAGVSGAAGAESVSTVPTTWPIVTSAPAVTETARTPLAGAGTVTVALSVSSSKRSLPSSTRSPAAFSHEARIPWVTDSPTDGTVISFFTSRSSLSRDDLRTGREGGLHDLALLALVPRVRSRC